MIPIAAGEGSIGVGLSEVDGTGMVTLFRIWGCVWIVICIITMGIIDYFLFSHRPPRATDLLEGVVLLPGILALLASVLIARFRAGEGQPRQ